jgi:hypothetical protein
VFPFTEEEAAKCGTEFANSIIQHFDTYVIHWVCLKFL